MIARVENRPVFSIPGDAPTGFTAENPKIWLMSDTLHVPDHPKGPIIISATPVPELRFKNRQERRAEAAKQRKRSW